MIEIIEIKKCNENVTQLINEMHCFGWTLKSSSVTGHDSIVGGGMNGFYSYTNVHDEITSLIFERDTEMPNYQKLRELYFEFENNSYCPIKVPKKIINSPRLLLLCILFPVMFMSIIAFGLTRLPIPGVVMLLALSIGLFLFDRANSKRNNEIKFSNNLNSENYSKYLDKRNQILNEAAKLTKGMQPIKKEVKQIPSNTSSDLDKLREYKKLLDENIITQEEFDNVKTKILNKQ